MYASIEAIYRAAMHLSGDALPAADGAPYFTVDRQFLAELDEALIKYHRTAMQPMPVQDTLCSCTSFSPIIMQRNYGENEFRQRSWFVGCDRCQFGIIGPFDTEDEAKIALEGIEDV